MKALPAAYLVDAVRTPIAKYKGALTTVRTDDLAAHVVRALVARNGALAARLDQIILGATNQAGEDNRNVARMAGLLAGLPYEVPAVTVNRLCGSGLEAVNIGAMKVMCGVEDLVIAGGVAVEAVEQLMNVWAVKRAGHRMSSWIGDPSR